jgi:hypothetical protein
MLGLDSITDAKIYSAWFSGRAGYALVVLGTCQ